MATQSILDLYLGRRLVLLKRNGKAPVSPGWQKVIPTEEEILNHRGNFGWLLDVDDLIIDVDVKNGKQGMESLAQLEKDTRTVIPRHIETPSGGLHCYMKIPRDFQGKDLFLNHSKYPGIDFLSIGRQVVIPPSVIGDVVYKLLKTDISGIQAPRSLLLTIYNKKKSEEKEDNNVYIEKAKKRPNHTPIEISQKLIQLDPNMSNDEWVKVGMALHDWDPVMGLKLWDEWSQNGKKYTKNDTMARWRSFKSNDEGITVGTLFYMAEQAHENRLSQESEIVEKCKKIFLENLQESQALVEQRYINAIPLVTAATLDNLVEQYIECCRKHLDRKLTKSDAKKLFEHKYTQAQTLELRYNEGYKWCANWIIVDSNNRYYDTENNDFVSEKIFNIRNGPYVPKSKMGTKPSAARFVADYGLLRDVKSPSYRPDLKELIFKENRTYHVNTFNERSVPPAADKVSDEVKEFMEFLHKHFVMLTGTEENAIILMSYIAHQVQTPGVKINWAPFIQSKPGIGKSFIKNLMKAVLGDENVGTVTSKVLNGNFNGWATGKCMNFFEEISIKGHNRYESLDSLKPIITDQFIQINEKNEKAYNTRNVTNYMCFTNYKDALPIDKNDRRFWVIFNEMERKEIEEYSGMQEQDYFDYLFTNIKDYASEIKRALLDYEIDPKFYAHITAPHTIYKEEMTMAEDSKINGLSEAKHLLENGGYNFNSEILVTKDFFAVLQIEYSTDFIYGKLSPAQKNRILQNLDMVQHRPMSLFGNNSATVWAKKRYDVDNDQIRIILKKHNDDNGYKPGDYFGNVKSPNERDNL